MTATPRLHGFDTNTLRTILIPQWKVKGPLLSEGEETHRVFGGQLNQQKVEPQKRALFPTMKAFISRKALGLSMDAPSLRRFDPSPTPKVPESYWDHPVWLKHGKAYYATQYSYGKGHDLWCIDKTVVADMLHIHIYIYITWVRVV